MRLTLLISKSNFKLASDCPAKLYYKRLGYPSGAVENPYLEFLADGGFMVEAIARALFGNGIEVDAADGESPAEATRRLLSQSTDVDLFEAVFEADGFSARVDILSKRGNRVRLIEIKAASYSSATDGVRPFRGARGGIDSHWRPYIEDLAFQTMVLRRALASKFTVVPELCIVDKSRTCSEGSTFRNVELTPAKEARFGKPRARFLGDPEIVRRDQLLGFVDATDEVEEVLAEVEPRAQAIREAFSVQPLVRPHAPLGRKCRDCEYRGASSPTEPDGFAECWKELPKAEHHILDLYRIDVLDGRDGHGIRELIQLGVSDIREIPDRFICGASTVSQRQRIHVASARSAEESIEPELRQCLAAAKYPLHFVDFETSRIALPHHAGMQPYEQVAFQFSCHTIATRGAELTHHEWINVVDAYPNFDFARSLREAMGDRGTMFVWSSHERSALRDIRRQFERYGERDHAIAEWIDDLAGRDDDSGRILDLHDLCRKHYFHPSMGGSTSIKYVLPAVWEQNANLRSHRWFESYARTLDGLVLSPYDALQDQSADGSPLKAVKDGTGAMRTYQEMMYGLQRENRMYREAQQRLLLQYCKLDTAAMVIVWMHWMQFANQGNTQSSNGATA